MKKLLAALALVLALPAAGQQVDSSQVKTKTNGGLTGDASNAVAVAPYRASSAPSSPVTGQLWCDTTTTPCTLKQYNGSTWEIPLNPGALATQTDVSSFPGSPSDGQIFFSKNPKALWVYDGTATKWYTLSMPMTVSGASIVDTYSNAVITAPASAATAATSGTAGSTSAGNYSYKVTFGNSTGGETTPSAASNSVAPGASKSNDLSSIPTGGTGTTMRRIYRSKANQDVTGPWYYVTTIADNSTTTLHDGAADSALTALAPTINFSGAMPGSWTYTATSGAAGGCGTTSRSTMACQSTATSTDSAVTADTAHNRAVLDISAYAAGSYTIQYRLTQASIMGDGTLGIISPVVMGFRNGTADNAIRCYLHLGGGGGVGTNVTFPLSSSNHTIMMRSERTSTAGSSLLSITVMQNMWPQADALPIWLRLVKRSVTLNIFTSPDGVNWTPLVQCNNTNNSTVACGMNAVWNNSTTIFEIPIGANQGSAQQAWTEIDSFSLTVN